MALAAHRRFGARTGRAPALLGVLLLGAGLIFADQAGHLPALIPLASIAALLLFSAADLAFSRRLFDARPSRWPVIGVTAAITAWSLRSGACSPALWPSSCATGL